MAEEAPAAPAAVPVKTTKKRAPKPRRAGPSVSDHIIKALSASKERSGVSLARLKKSLHAEGYDVEKNNKRVKAVIKRLVDNGILIQVKGTGASGSFKMGKKVETKAPKPAKKTATAATKVKKAAPKKSPAAKKAKSATATPKKSPAKKSPKKARKSGTAKPASKSPKSAKSPKKTSKNTKKTAKSPKVAAKRAPAAKKAAPKRVVKAKAKKGAAKKK